MQSSPSTVYSQSVDKQRIVVIGKGSSRITGMIIHVLRQCNRRFDFSTPTDESLSEAAVVIIEPAQGSNTLSEYHHHVLIISQLAAADEAAMMKLANATPKSGTIIYDDGDAIAAKIAKVERADISTSSYQAAKYEMQNGKIILVSSTNEKSPTQLSDIADLKSIGAAKELLKKIGISSGQFYRAISSFQ